ncbi:hypothetical protein MVEN_01205300 [Mycena venus]|uniref:F-box domain-containing protein n=1 Tax=Mycena venus TaxID=2733690 RepID=A0A8H6Y4S1_9AGAR|nr:hypothetical protein MVEN_01205300 [Mycena venus]
MIISNLEILRPGGQFIFTTLQNSDLARLQTLELQLAGPIPGELLDVVLPNLASLAVVTSSMDLLAHLSTPHLKHLRLDCPYSHNILERLRPFLRRSAHCLARLELSNAQIRDLDLIDLLGMLPNLTELDIHCAFDRQITDTLFIALHTLKTVPCLAPKLQCLSLGGDLYGSESMLLDAIESRWEGYHNDEMACDRLLSIQFHLVHIYSVETMARLCALSDSGMDVCLFRQKPGQWVRNSGGGYRLTSSEWVRVKME